jgi:hypothetical protein
VRIRTADGRELFAEQAMPRSHWANEVPDGDVREKFRSNAGYALDGGRAEEVRDVVGRLETLDKVGTLGELLSVGREEA